MSTTALKDVVALAAHWPADQQELADYARIIEARRTGLYRMTASERSAVAEGIRQADTGDFVDEAALVAFNRRVGL